MNRNSQTHLSDQTQATAENRSGIGEAMIEHLERVFYGRAPLGPLIGPIFEVKMHDRYTHIRPIGDLWSSITLKSGRYCDHPMAAPIPLPVGTPHFDRWLEIFAETACKNCPPEAAAQFLQLGIAAQNGRMDPVPKRNPPV